MVFIARTMHYLSIRISIKMGSTKYLVRQNICHVNTYLCIALYLEVTASFRWLVVLAFSGCGKLYF